MVTSHLILQKVMILQSQMLTPAHVNLKVIYYCSYNYHVKSFEGDKFYCFSSLMKTTRRLPRYPGHQHHVTTPGPWFPLLPCRLKVAKGQLKLVLVMNTLYTERHLSTVQFIHQPSLYVSHRATGLDTPVTLFQVTRVQFRFDRLDTLLN